MLIRWWLILHSILPAVRPQLDPQQFAHRARRGPDDAVVRLLHSLLWRLDPPGNFASAHFVNFSSSSQWHQITRTLRHFIIDRGSQLPQQRATGRVTSSAVLSNIGAPHQGDVLGPVLYTIYANFYTCLSLYHIHQILWWYCHTWTTPSQ